MKSNPYAHIINIIREQGAKYNPASIQLGEVIDSKPTIKTADIQLNANNLLVNDQIKTLNQGDTVALIQLNDAAFLIFCKVVNI
ncbi:MAG: DUF2577 family protein [Bacillota bacterium]|nr:DUF2577 family protein [Bacillota bacterium]